MKLSIVSGWDSFLFVFLALVPLMAIFAVPLAAGLAVHTTIGNLITDDELLVVQFFSAAKRVLLGAVLLFTFMVASIYIPLSFHWAPQSYLAGKRVLLQLAKRQFYQFEAGKFYTPFPGVTFFFKHKSGAAKRPFYSRLFLGFNGKHGEQYFFTAKQGVLKNNCLYLLNGSVYTVNAGKHHVAMFDQTEINLKKIYDIDGSSLLGMHAKFLSIGDLVKIKDSHEADYEFYKRIAQVIWLLLFPLLAFMNILAYGSHKSNLLLGIFFNGTIFLISYVSMSLAQVIWAHSLAGLGLLYGFIAIIFAIVLTMYLRKR